MKTDIKSLTLEELTQFVKELGEPAYRAKQIFGWLHEKTVKTPEEMHNLPGQLREKLQEACEWKTLDIRTVQASKKDGTRKYLFAAEDGNCIESVFMPYHHGNSVCVSSQVGCRMGCAFCASGIDGWARNLTASEMLEQVYGIQRDTKERVSHVVIMGTGEPLDNYENVLRFIRLLTREPGQRISQRNITLSTCGLVPQIERLAEEQLEITLAISLHAVSDAERREIMPVARRYCISELLEAAEHYFEKTKRRISYEYSLIAGVNDSPGHAKALAKLLAGQNCHVNLIRVNPVAGKSYRQTTDAAALNFQNMLEKSGINVTIRREMGRDIDGACGQLRRRYLQQDPAPAADRTLSLQEGKGSGKESL